MKNKINFNKKFFDNFFDDNLKSIFDYKTFIKKNKILKSAKLYILYTKESSKKKKMIHQ